MEIDVNSDTETTLIIFSIEVQQMELVVYLVCGVDIGTLPE